MSTVACETVLRVIDAYNRRDLDALRAEMHPEVMLQGPLTALAGNVYRGHAGVADWLGDLDETFARARIEPREVEALGTLVLAITTFSVEAGESRLPLDSELGLLLGMRDDLIVSWAGHFDHEAARAEGRASLVREAIEAYNRRDPDAMAALMSADVDLRPPVSALWGAAYRGHEGIRQWLADVEDSFAHARIVPLEFEDHGGLVLALTSFDVKGEASEFEFNSELGLLCEIGAGRIVSWKGHFSHAAARAEAEQERQGPRPA